MKFLKNDDFITDKYIIFISRLFKFDSIVIHRCLFDMLGALLHLQHHGCNLHEVDKRMPTWCYSFHRYFLVRLHEQLRESRNIYCVQPRIP